MVVYRSACEAELQSHWRAVCPPSKYLLQIARASKLQAVREDKMNKKAGFWLHVTSIAAATALSVTAHAATVDGVEVSDRFCLTCHGADGQGNVGIDAPRLAGMERWYLKHQLELFRDGLRGTHPEDLPGREMQPMAAILTDESIEDILDWAEQWEYQAAEVTLSGDTRRGEELYASCSACHGEEAQGNEALRAPALAGQNDFYLYNQLKNFKAGVRGYDRRDQYGTQMRLMAQKIADEEAMRDIVAYINTLGR